MKDRLDPKSFWLFFINFILQYFFPFFLTTVFIIFAFSNDFFRHNSFWISLWLVVPSLLIIGFIHAKLTWHFYRYEMTENGFQKEFGIIWKRSITIPYDRIQNVDIQRGLVARILGLSDLQIQTAGSSPYAYGLFGAVGAGSEGRLQGLPYEAAERLRDDLIIRAKNSKNQGL